MSHQDIITAIRAKMIPRDGVAADVFAEATGRKISTIRKYALKGMPHVRYRNTLIIDVDPAIAWMRGHGKNPMR